MADNRNEDHERDGLSQSDKEMRKTEQSDSSSDLYIYQDLYDSENEDTDGENSLSNVGGSSGAGVTGSYVGEMLRGDKLDHYGIDQEGATSGAAGSAVDGGAAAYIGADDGSDAEE